MHLGSNRYRTGKIPSKSLILITFPIGPHCGPIFMLNTIIISLIGALALFGYLQPFHSAPWPSAFSDGAFLIIGLLLILNKILSNGVNKISISSKELVVISLLSLFLLRSYFIDQNLSVWPYVLTLSIAITIYKLEQTGQSSLYIFQILIWIAATITAFLTLGQWLGIWQELPTRYFWLLEGRPFERIVGNLGQPNLTGSLLIWGVVSAVFIGAKISNTDSQDYKKRIFNVILLTTVLIGSVVAALLESRTTTLSFILVVLMAWRFKDIIRHGAIIVLVTGLFLHLMIVFLPFSSLGDASGDYISKLYGGKGLGSNSRIEAYKTFVNAVLMKPFFGFGFGGVTTAFIEGTRSYHGLRTYFSHVHNILLELFVVFGIPVAAFLTYVSATYLYKRYSEINNITSVFSFLMLVVIGAHSMLEFPLHHVFFLLPSIVFLAHLQPISVRLHIAIPRLVLSLWFFIILFILVGIIKEYFFYDSAIRQARLELAITGRTHPVTSDTSFFLKELHNANVIIRTDLGQPLSSEQIITLHSGSKQFPMRPFILKTIDAMHSEGDISSKEYWIKKFCAIYQPNTCLNKNIYSHQ